MSANVGSRRNAGPFAFGFSIVFATRMYSSFIPWWSGYAPVPIVAWIVGVFDGDDPTVAFVNQAPCGISDLRYGHSFFQWSRTSMPPESHTSCTNSRGGVPRCEAGRSASVIGLPYGAWNPSKFRNSASVGAMSADVTGRSSTPSFTHGAPYQKIGTSCVYGHGVACVSPPVTNEGCWEMIWMSPLRSRRRPLHVRRRISCGALHAIFANGARLPSCDTEKPGVVEPT